MNHHELKDFISDFAAEAIGAAVGLVVGIILPIGPVGRFLAAIVGGVIPVVFKFVRRVIKGNDVLILEDDPNWLSRHKGYLEKAGLKVYATQIASEAIELFNNNKSIRFAVLDQILKVPGTESIQNDTGIDVARAIHQNGIDSGREAIVYLVTDSVQIKVDGEVLIDPKKVHYLEEPGIVHKVIPKYYIDYRAEETYRKIIRDIKKN